MEKVSRPVSKLYYKGNARHLRKGGGRLEGTGGFAHRLKAELLTTLSLGVHQLLSKKGNFTLKHCSIFFLGDGDIYYFLFQSSSNVHRGRV